jgi:hypothetical protein
MKYILKHKSGSYQLNIDMPFEEFKKLKLDKKEPLTLFYLDGHYAGVVDQSFLDECDVSEEQVMLPMEQVENGGQGFLAMIYPFEREKVLEVLKEMGFDFAFDSPEAIEYYVTDEPEEFLTRYRNTTYQKGTFKRCIISERDNTITFITNWGFLADPKKILFSIENKLFIFNFSERYKIYFIPAGFNSANYKRFS